MMKLFFFVKPVLEKNLMFKVNLCNIKKTITRKHYVKVFHSEP